MRTYIILKYLFITLVLSGFNSWVWAQSIVVSSASSTTEVQGYVENILLGSCITASNISYTGPAIASGIFDGSGSVLGIDGGIILTTGQASNAEGPDNSNNAGYNHQNVLGAGYIGEDADLTVLAGIATRDAVILEFDFIPESDTLRFNYIFGSEEYPEYINAGYNDAFGFFISGPGISGPFTGGAENIALIPGTSIPVAIDNVNNGYSANEPSSGPCTNCAYYVDNSNGSTVQYDGYTKVLSATAVVVPCQAYHIKLAIADGGDHVFDSGVFLQGGSFSAGGGSDIELVGTTTPATVSEGCSNSGFVFRRIDTNNSSAVSGSFVISGTATAGIDYTSLSTTATIPAGQDSVIIYVDALLDFTAEGPETVIVTMNAACSCQAQDEAIITILDNDIPLALTTSGTTTICLGESANLIATPSGSITPYSGGWDNGALAGNNVTVSPTQTTTYTYTVADACNGQSLTSSETVTVVTPYFLVDDYQQCFDGNDFIFTNTGASGGNITHFWDFGDGTTSIDEHPSRSYVTTGIYSVTHTVTYSVSGCTVTADTVMDVFQDPSVTVSVIQDVSCVGGTDGAMSSIVSGGNSPYTYFWIPNGEVTPSISDLATGNYTVTVTDVNGCTDNVTEMIIQNDVVVPIAICQSITVQLNASGFVTISALDVDNGSSDNCGISSMVVSPNAFDCTDLGVNPVVLTVTDINGNVSTCNATVTVEDIIPPVATCQDVSVQLDVTGNVSITTSQVENGSTDNCVIQSISVSPNTFDCSNIGANAVILTVMDASGNTSTCTATVTILEETNPAALCQNITVQLNASGNASITAAQVGGGSADNCSVANLAVNPSTFDCTNVGGNSVTVTATDGSGNMAACLAIVTVEDNVAPIAICQNTTVQLDASGNASATVSDVDGGSTDNCAIDSLLVDPNNFTCADIGANSVTLTVTDVAGNTSTCSASVMVENNIGPSAVCQDITVVLDVNGQATIVATQIDNGSTDNCGGSLTLSISPNSFDCTVNTPAQVELTVTDVSGNTSTCTATVTLTENTLPTAVCQDITIQLDAIGNASIVAADVDGGSFDNCGIANLSVNPSTFHCSNIGPNTVTLTVSDASGNSSTCTATVTVEDNIAPTAICQNITVQLDASGNATIIAANVDGGSADNCGVSNLSVTPNSFTCANLGSTTVTLTVEDANGNTSTCNAIVIVEDDVPPSAICQDITVELDATGNVSIVASQIDNGSTDLCGIANVSLDITAFDCSNTGANSVELTVEDNSGNVATCAAVVTVDDNISPNAICQNLTIYLDENGLANILPIEVDNGSTDNCTIDSYLLSQSDFMCVNLGQTVVILTVADMAGNTDECASVITILDTISPVIIACPSDMVVVPDSSDCSPQVFWAEPTVEDNCTPTITSNFSPGNIFPIGTTTVIYSAEDQSGNTAFCAFEITIEPPPVIVSITSTEGLCGHNLSCNGAEDGVATASAIGGCLPYSFLWSDNQTTQTAVDLSSGPHIVIVTDANGTQAIDTIILTQPEPLSTDSISSPEFIGGANISCNGGFDGAININVLGGSDCLPYDFSWAGPNGFISADEDLSSLGAGTFVLTVTDGSGCVHIDSISLIEPEPISVQLNLNMYNGFNISCFGLSDGLIDLTVSEGTVPYTYLWSTTTGSVQANGETTEDIDSLSTGTYDVVVSDANGCQVSESLTLIEPAQIEIIPVDTTQVSCNGEENGQFVVQPAGGVPAFSFLWSNGDTDPNLNDVGIGIYEVLVTDLNGCQDSLELEMTEPTSLDVAVLQITHVTCFDGDNGSATIEASGGATPYSYNWSPISQINATATDLSAGEHIYEVTDANGCLYSGSIEIEQPDQIILIASNDTNVCPGTVVQLSVEASGGGGTFLITWDNGQAFGTTYEPTITSTTNIPVMASDQNGCQAAPNSVVVTTYEPVVAAFEETIVDACSFPVEVDFVNNSTNAIGYNWTFGNGTTSTQFLPSTSYDSAQIYTVSLLTTSPDGCVDSTFRLVTIDSLPEANFNIPNPDGCFPIMVELLNQSSPAIAYFWDFGDGFTSNESNPHHLYEESGSYDVTLIITNANGCSDTLAVDSAVFAYPRPTADFTPVHFSSESISEFQMINNSFGATDYFWTFGNGDNSTLVEPVYDYPEHGSYSIILRATNEYGCTDTAIINVDVELISGLFVPNAMIIGEVGEPGMFLPKGAGIGEFDVAVYDKWGNILWASNKLIGGSPAEGWDGRYKGQFVPQGAYVWKINARFKDGSVWEGVDQSNGKKVITGSVMVLF